MNIHEQRLVDALRQQVADLQARVDRSKRPAERGPAKDVNPALLWQERTGAVIRAAVAAEFGGDPDELMQPGARKRYVVMRRQIAMHLCRHVGMSLLDAASALGCANHTTVLHALTRVEKMRQTPAVADAIARLEAVVSQQIAEAMAA